MESIGQVTYKLELPDTMNIHRILHVSQLRKATGSVFPQLLAPRTVQLDLSIALHPISVLGVRKTGATIQSPNDFKILSHWEGMTIEDATLTNFQTFTLRKR